MTLTYDTNFGIVRYVRPTLWTCIDTFSGAFIEMNQNIFHEVKNTCDLCQIFVSLTYGYPALTMPIIILISRKLYDISSVSCHDFIRSPFFKWNPKMLHRERFLWGCHIFYGSAFSQFLVKSDIFYLPFYLLLAVLSLRSTAVIKFNCDLILKLKQWEGSFQLIVPWCFQCQ